MFKVKFLLFQNMSYAIVQLFLYVMCDVKWKVLVWIKCHLALQQVRLILYNIIALYYY